MPVINSSTSDNRPGLAAQLELAFMAKANEVDYRLKYMAMEGQITWDECFDSSREQPHQRSMRRVAERLRDGSPVNIQADDVLRALREMDAEVPGWLSEMNPSAAVLVESQDKISAA
jgi:hypothetical protein